MKFEILGPSHSQHLLAEGIYILINIRIIEERKGGPDNKLQFLPHLTFFTDGKPVCRSQAIHVDHRAYHY